MFGRKRKKDEESVGLAGLGTGGISPSFEPTPGVSITAQPVSPETTAMPASPAPAIPGPTVPAPTAPAPTPQLPTSAAPATPSTPPPSTPPPATPPTGAAFELTGLSSQMTQTNPVALLGQILSGHGPVGELVAQIRADPEAFRQRMIAQVEAAGGSGAMISTQWNAQLATGTPQAPGHPQPVDVIDELTKAADLHHKGVLTDAEFEAYKKKLLGG
jgi:hypothetical protein